MLHRLPTSRYDSTLVALLTFVALISASTLAFADPGATELFVRDTTSVLRHLHASFEGAAIQRGYSDRELHFSVSIPLGAIGYQLAAVMLSDQQPRWKIALTGFALGMVPGVAKEFVDMSSPTNYFSWRDIGYDTAGVLTGILIIWAINRVVSKSKHQNSFSHY